MRDGNITNVSDVFQILKQNESENEKRKSKYKGHVTYKLVFVAYFFSHKVCLHIL